MGRPDNLLMTNGRFPAEPGHPPPHWPPLARRQNTTIPPPHCPNTVGAGVLWSGVGAFMAARPWGQLCPLSFARGSVEPVAAAPVSDDQPSPPCFSSH